MPPLMIFATIDVAPGKRDALLPILKKHRDSCRDEEPGTLVFKILLPEKEESKVLIYELYKDRAAFEAHWNGPTMARTRKEAGEMITNISGTFCALVD